VEIAPIFSMRFSANPLTVFNSPVNKVHCSSRKGLINPEMPEIFLFSQALQYSGYKNSFSLIFC